MELWTLINETQPDVELLPIKLKVGESIESMERSLCEKTKEAEGKEQLKSGLRIRKDLFPPMSPWEDSSKTNVKLDNLTLYDATGKNNCEILYKDFGPNTMMQFFKD